MKKTLSLLFFSFFLTFVCSCSRELTGGDSVVGIIERIKTIDEQVTAIQSSLETLETVDSNLNAAVDTLRTEVASLELQQEELLSKVNKDWAAISVIRDSVSFLNGEIEILEAGGVYLEDKIDDLKAYADSLVYGLNGDTRDWASTTLATLKQFDSLCTAVATMQSRLDSLDDGHKTLLSESVANLETTMKDWVNEKFNAYYTIEQTDAKLAALSSADSTLKDDVRAQADALEKMKQEVTDEYEAAIRYAVDTLGGVLDDKIDADLDALESELQGTIDGINGRIDAMEEKLAAMDKDISRFLSLVRSISVIPDYPDGSVKVDEKEYDFTVNLAIYPLSAADSIAKNKLPVKFEIQTSGTESSEFTSIEVLELSYDSGTSLLKLRVKREGLPQTVKNNEQRAFARAVFYDGKDKIASDFFPLTYYVELTGVKFVSSSTVIRPYVRTSIPVQLIPENATDSRLTFRSLNILSVWVSSSGDVVGKKGGISQIVVSSVENPAFCDTCEVRVIEENTLPGVFSVSASKKVSFSRGTLRAVKSKPDSTEYIQWEYASFHFAPNQLDALGSKNLNGSSLADSVDLFGWSDTNTNSPWGISLSEKNADYCKGDTDSFRDWGQNIGDGWTVLTKNEWDYLLNRSPGLYKKGVKIGSLKNNLILAPDGYAKEIRSEYTDTEWAEAEKEGLVCILFSYNRIGKTIYYDQSGYGNTWYRTSTPHDSEGNTKSKALNSARLEWNTPDHYHGLPVRLVYVLPE